MTTKEMRRAVIGDYPVTQIHEVPAPKDIGLLADSIQKLGMVFPVRMFDAAAGPLEIVFKVAIREWVAIAHTQNTSEREEDATALAEIIRTINEGIDDNINNPPPKRIRRLVKRAIQSIVILTDAAFSQTMAVLSIPELQCMHMLLIQMDDYIDDQIPLAGFVDSKGAIPRELLLHLVKHQLSVRARLTAVCREISTRV
jgi:hypothetical protein